MADRPEHSGRHGGHRGYALTVVTGLAGAGLAAVAGAQEWAAARGDAAGLRVEDSVGGADAQPLAAALALVALASWGVVLVLRGRVRRLVAGVGLLAGAGCLVAVVLGHGRARAAALEAAVAQGASAESVSTALTAWYVVAGVGAALTTVAFAVAVRHAPRWPGMGSRYDAPTAPGRRAPASPATEEDMWRALDEGRDPTS